MILFAILIVLLSLYRSKVSGLKNFNDEYLSFDSTSAIKGIFILFVFMNHCLHYVWESGFEYVHLYDKLGAASFGLFGQLIVVMFLFYSGYGVNESIKKKGVAYVNSIPKKRIINTLLNFNVAVILFIFLDAFLHIDYSMSEVALSFIAWEDVGNSNWYIFDILLCYAITWLCAKLFAKRSAPYRIGMGGVIVILAIYLLSEYKTNPVWSNTLLCYPLGMAFSQYKSKIEPFVQKYYYVLLSIATIIVAATFLTITDEMIWLYNVKSCVFVFFIVLLTLKIHIKNEALIWCGKNLFPLYIYQRIPMIALFTVLGADFVKEFALLYIALSLFVSVVIAHFYKHINLKIA